MIQQGLYKQSQSIARHARSVFSDHHRLLDPQNSKRVLGILNALELAKTPDLIESALSLVRTELEKLLALEEGIDRQKIDTCKGSIDLLIGPEGTDQQTAPAEGSPSTGQTTSPYENVLPLPREKAHPPHQTILLGEQGLPPSQGGRRPGPGFTQIEPPSVPRKTQKISPAHKLASDDPDKPSSQASNSGNFAFPPNFSVPQAHSQTLPDGSAGEKFAFPEGVSLSQFAKDHPTGETIYSGSATRTVQDAGAAPSEDPILKHREAFLKKGFELERVIGQGGMGIVMLAKDTKHNRSVAIKIILVPGRDPAREARLAGPFNQDHGVVPVYDSGFINNYPYLIMPYLGDVRDLEDLPDDLEVLPRLVACLGMAKSIQNMHSEEVLHKDIKPANFLSTGVENGEVEELLEGMKVYGSDFGLARKFSENDPNTTVGTPLFMSPEQARGEPIAAPSDVYSLGVTKYKVLTGRHPYPESARSNTVRLLSHVVGLPRPAISKEDQHLKDLSIPPEIIELLSEMTDPHPLNRPKMERVVEVFTRFIHSQRKDAKEIQKVRSLPQRLLRWGLPAVVITLVLAGGVKLYKNRQLMQEATDITASLKDGIKGMDLRDEKYSSVYFAQRLKDIKRVREIYGDEIDPKLSEKLARQEKLFELLRRGKLFRETFNKFTKIHTDYRNDPSNHAIFLQAAELALDFLKYFDAEGFHYTAPASTSAEIPSEFIVPSTTDPRQAAYAGSLTALAPPKNFQMMCEYLRRTLGASSHLGFSERYDTLTTEMEFRAASWVVTVTGRSLYINPASIKALPVSVRIELMHAVIRSCDYFLRLHVALSKEPENAYPQLKEELRHRLCRGSDIMIGLVGLIPDPSLLQPSTSR